MICFPNAKINIGLEVIRKREDHYHDLETVFYPVSLSDILELNESDQTRLTLSGLNIDNRPDSNLVLKAYHLLKEVYNLPPVEFHLHKIIPAGAGLGGGSSDAAFTLTGLNELFKLNISKNMLMDYASNVGSDCAFFILNQPVFAQGKGNIFSDLPVFNREYSLVLIKPPISVSTALAYSGILPKVPEYQLKELVKHSVESWKDFVFNRFEDNVFPLFPPIKKIKEHLYEYGAIYASMSGSGSTVYGLFKEIPEHLAEKFPECFFWEEKCLF